MSDEHWKKHLWWSTEACAEMGAYAAKLLSGASIQATEATDDREGTTLFYKDSTYLGEYSIVEIKKVRDRKPKTMKLQDLLAQPVKGVDRDLEYFVTTFLDDLPDFWDYDDDLNIEGVEVRWWERGEIGGRCWCFGYVSMDDKPVMLLQLAGRGPRDHCDTVTIDHALHHELVGKIRRRFEEAERADQGPVKDILLTDDVEVEFWGSYLNPDKEMTGE